MHLVLIRLKSDARECRIAVDTLRLAQVTVPRGKSVVKQFLQINLAARLRQHVEIFIVNVDVTGCVRLFDLFRKNVAIDEIFGTLGAVFEHRAHRRVGVDVGILAFHVNIVCARERHVLIQLHQIVNGVASTSVRLAVNDEGFRRAEQPLGE